MFTTRTNDPFPNSLCVRYRLQLVTVFQTRHAVRARRRSDCNNELIVPVCASVSGEATSGRAERTYGMYMRTPGPPPGTIVSTSRRRSDMTRSIARALMRWPRRRAAIFRSGSTRERTETVPTAAAIHRGEGELGSLAHKRG